MKNKRENRMIYKEKKKIRSKTYPRPALRVLKINFNCPRYLLSIKYRTEEHAYRATWLPRKAVFSSFKLWALMLEKRDNSFIKRDEQIITGMLTISSLISV